MVRVEVLDYDVWGNQKEGYEVNDIYRRGNVDLKDFSRREIVRKFKEAGYLVPRAHANSFEVDTSIGDGAELLHKRTGRPLFGLRVIDDGT